MGTRERFVTFYYSALLSLYMFVFMYSLFINCMLPTQFTHIISNGWPGLPGTQWYKLGLLILTMKFFTVSRKMACCIWQMLYICFVSTMSSFHIWQRPFTPSQKAGTTILFPFFWRWTLPKPALGFGSHEEPLWPKRRFAGLVKLKLEALLFFWVFCTLQSAVDKFSTWKCGGLGLNKND